MTVESPKQPDQVYGSIDAKGHWKPPYPAAYAPLFTWPVDVKAVLTWLFGFPGLLWPFNTFILLFSVLTLTYIQPDIESCKTLRADWIGLMLLRNLLILLVMYGGIHWIYYTNQLAGKGRKYNPSYQQETRRQFWFGKQPRDNIARSLIFGLPIWTAYEVLYVWASANGRVPFLSFQEHPLAFISWFFVILLVRETHFYFIHRLIHWGPLFKYVHSVHHLNPNPGPWSGLAMHPVEHVLYFSGVLIHFILPSHPLHFFFHMQHLAIGPVVGHLGFESPRALGKPLASDYFHYLHHKYVTCNFGMDMMPWDRWLGVYFDGTGEYRPRQRKSKEPA